MEDDINQGFGPRSEALLFTGSRPAEVLRPALGDASLAKGIRKEKNVVNDIKIQYNRFVSEE